MTEEIAGIKWYSEFSNVCSDIKIHIHIVPLEIYTGDLDVIYTCWCRYVSSQLILDEHLLFPLIIFQNMLFRNMDGILAVCENRIIGVACFIVDSKKNLISHGVSASPADILHSNYIDIEDLLEMGLSEYSEKNGLNFLKTDKIRLFDLQRVQNLIRKDSENTLFGI